MTEHVTKEQCIEGVVEAWEDTSLAESWMVVQWQINDYAQLQMSKTHYNFKKEDFYVAIGMLAKMVGLEQGHSEEYANNLQQAVFELLKKTIGRSPMPQPLPLAPHLTQNAPKVVVE